MQPYTLTRPTTAALPLVCDSPHSGTWYPDDFGHAIERAALRRSEDTHVDRLWDRVPAMGGTLVCATFPRSYIDPNRHEADLDVSMIQDGWPREVGPVSRASELGMSLVWRKTPEHRDIYARKLSSGEVLRRIEQFWRPYRDAVAREIDAAHARHGACWHLNLHSMPSNVYERLGLPPRPAADIVLGDRRGTTCEPAFTILVREAFEAEGLSVAINDPYEGAELVRVHGDPARKRHSLQIEINRGTYMDEATREPNAGFGSLKKAIDSVLVQVAGYVAQQVSLPRAHAAAQADP
jgi:N-formylglutamate deformylase